MKFRIFCVPRMKWSDRDLFPFILYDEAFCEDTQTISVRFIIIIIIIIIIIV